MSLKSYYCGTYSENVGSLVNAYGKCLLKLSKCRNHVVFSARCKKLGFVPHSLRIKSPVNSAQGWKIARNAGHRFLNERLRVANQKVRELEDERKWRELGLKRVLSKDDFTRMRVKSQTLAERAFEKVREKQRQKFERQYGQQYGQGGEGLKADKSKWVINLSKRELKEEERAVLERGMKFAPAPSLFQKWILW